jgi:hypothetical protein
MNCPLARFKHHRFASEFMALAIGAPPLDPFMSPLRSEILEAVSTVTRRRLRMNSG